MMKGYRYIRLLAIISVLLVYACDNHVDDGEGDCSTVYQLNFVYDYNMKYANAFPHEVKSVSAYLFDESGQLVYTKSDLVDPMDASDYQMVLDIQSGTYDVLVWGGVAGSDAYQVPEVKVGTTTKEELTCWINRRQKEGLQVVDRKLPSLFYGKAEHVVFESHSDLQTVNVQLKKNTNNFTFVLQQLSGEPIDMSLFEFRITDANGFMNWDNTLLKDDMLTYLPWSVSQGFADVVENDSSVLANTATVSVALAEFSVNRLVKGHQCLFTLLNKQTGEKVLSIPLVDYCLLVKGNYNKEMSDQEYLDRQDVYNLTFFLDADRKWASAVIYINSWRIILHDVGI